MGDHGAVREVCQLVPDFKVITCGGRFSVNDTPKPWISEPQGVSIEYHRGHPLGMVVGIWVSADGMRISRRVPIGGSADVTAPFDGSLWVQVNDSSSSRDNNDGIVEVLLNRAPSKRLQP